MDYKDPAIPIDGDIFARGGHTDEIQAFLPLPSEYKLFKTNEEFDPNHKTTSLQRSTQSQFISSFIEM